MIKHRMSSPWVASFVALGLALSLAACSPEPYQGVVETESMRAEGRAKDSMTSGLAVAEAAADFAAAPAPMDAPVVQQQPDVGGGQASPEPAESRQIAYEYSFTFAVPTGSMEGLLNAQKAACEAAGPSRCYVVSSSLSGLGQDTTYGAMQLKAAPDWVAQFRAGLPNALKPFDALLDASTETSEDLTVQLIDTNSRLKSLKTLRDRLQQLLADRPGRLADLLEIERELARVQQEIDSTESILAAMRARVAMSTLTLAYQPKYSAVSQSVWRPLGDAFSSFLPRAVDSLAVFVAFVAGILPWLVIGLVLLLALQFVWKLTFGRRKKAKPALPPIAT